VSQAAAHVQTPPPAIAPRCRVPKVAQAVLSVTPLGTSPAARGRKARAHLGLRRIGRLSSTSRSGRAARYPDPARLPRRGKLRRPLLPVDAEAVERPGAAARDNTFSPNGAASGADYIRQQINAPRSRGNKLSPMALLGQSDELNIEKQRLELAASSGHEPSDFPVSVLLQGIHETSIGFEELGCPPASGLAASNRVLNQTIAIAGLPQQQEAATSQDALAIKQEVLPDSIKGIRWMSWR
jgi:hypothetical protein